MLRLPMLLGVSFIHRAFSFATYGGNLLSGSYYSAYRATRQVLYVPNTRDADFLERMVGGERYEMIPLPDSMVETTLFVGNLCEFVTDELLSDLFQKVSTLHSVPACVIRKPNMASLQYGFVTFPNVAEKEAAILKFHGHELNGRRINVEPIRDAPNCNRVRIPEKMVAYLCGAVKKTRDGRVNQLRRISKDDVERLSRGQPSKKKGYGSRNVPHRLNEDERQEMNRASKRGYLTLAGTGYRRGRKGSPLANIHRQWCDAREKPQIVLCKASGGRPLDNVIVDLSPLRLNGLFESQPDVEDFLIKWKTEILTAAERAGMVLRDEYVEDNTLSMEDEPDDDLLDDSDQQGTSRTEYTVMVNSESWATEPIWRLPVVSLGVFEGERSRAKAMAKELAELWDIPEQHVDGGDGAKSRKSAGARKGGKTKMKGISHHRRPSRDRDAW